MVIHLILFCMLGCVAVSVDIRVRRGEYYDTIFWDGDCRKIKASFAGFGEEKICICRKRVNTNGKWRELDGTFYQNMGTSPSCLYDYRETGANFFLGHSSHSVFVVNDHSPGTKIRLMQGRSHWFRRSNPISIKEVRSLNYKKDKRFTKIEGNIFHLTNSSIDVNRPNAYPKYQYYYIQVNGSDIKKIRGHLIKIIFEYEYKHHGVRENIGFAVIKVVGDVTYDLDVQSLQNSIPLQSQKVELSEFYCSTKNEIEI